MFVDKIKLIEDGVTRANTLGVFVEGDEAYYYKTSTIASLISEDEYSDSVYIEEDLPRFILKKTIAIPIDEENSYQFDLEELENSPLDIQEKAMSAILSCIRNGYGIEML